MVIGRPVDRSSASLQSAVKRGIGVHDVQMNVRRSGRNLFVRIACFDHAIADGHFRVHQLAVRHGNAQAFGARKCILQKLDELRRAIHNDVGRDGRKSRAHVMDGLRSRNR